MKLTNLGFLLGITALGLSGCKTLKLHDQEVKETNKKVIIDTKYLNAPTAEKSIQHIRGFGESTTVGESNTFESATTVPYYLNKHIKYDVESNTLNFISSASKSAQYTEYANGMRISFTETSKGVYESKKVYEYTYNKILPVTGKPFVTEDDEYFGQLQFNVDRAIEELRSTYSMMDIQIKSEYSKEAITATLKREFDARFDGKNYISQVKLDGQNLPIVFNVSSYKKGSIITGKAGVPVKVDGNKFIYGARLDELLEIINIKLES
ncbi:hypothetical protein [Photobacterium leiognathi]|uniref:hypothetical protein n=1 Tax=Photobacterium leiognathi TaxID=553611 RepID=UPI0029814A42|nr:hypothetical protein [Photobacterium leiognathi]